MKKNTDETLDHFLKIDNLSASYGKIKALHKVSLNLSRGKMVALIGANGAGKSTFLRCLSGLKKADGGTLYFQGKNIIGYSVAERVKGGMAHVLEGRALFSNLCVKDNIQLGAYLQKKPGKEDMQKVFQHFPALAEKLDASAASLSGGQQQMLAIARALMSQPLLLLLDEPSMGLSPILVKEVFQIIHELKGQGVSILLVEQNASLALQYCDYAYVIENGSIVLEGSGEFLAENEAVKKAYLGI